MAWLSLATASCRAASRISPRAAGFRAAISCPVPLPRWRSPELAAGLLGWSCRHCSTGATPYAQKRSPETPQNLRLAPVSPRGSTGGRTDGLLTRPGGFEIALGRAGLFGASEMRRALWWDRRPRRRRLAPKIVGSVLMPGLPCFDARLAARVGIHGSIAVNADPSEGMIVSIIEVRKVFFAAA
jgi:hypothetical protein